MKAPGSTGEGHWKLGNLSAEEESGIPRVAVKCVEMWRNTSGEGDSLVCNSTLRSESVGSRTGLDTLVVHAVNDEC